mmetsp:Transcript_104028/g.299451  ORF Transcript_104028/g.299451 Transcript_104028/m.299451 type:complete len:255 (+) Transcript_104028:2102-2866(+)
MNSANNNDARRVPYIAFKSCQRTPSSSSPRGGMTTNGSSSGNVACQNAVTTSYSPRTRRQPREHFDDAARDKMSFTNFSGGVPVYVSRRSYWLNSIATHRLRTKGLPASSRRSSSSHMLRTLLPRASWADTLLNKPCSCMFSRSFARPARTNSGSSFSPVRWSNTSTLPMSRVATYDTGIACAVFTARGRAQTCKAPTRRTLLDSAVSSPISSTRLPSKLSPGFGESNNRRFAANGRELGSLAMSWSCSARGVT